MGAQIVGNYEVAGLLAQGAMCKVARGKDRRDGRDVALKFFRVPDVGEKVRKEILTRLERQVQAATTVQSPNVIRVYESFEINGIQCIVMELIEGLTVRTMLEQERALSVSKAAGITMPIAHALDDLHVKGIIHRGVKPEHILVQPDGTAKLTTFCVAELISEQQIVYKDADPGAVVPPEPIHDLRSDRLALGCTLYEMVAGKKPFQEAADGEPPRPAGVPEYLYAILRKALAIHPPSRYQSGRELAKDLQDQHAPAPPRPPQDAMEACAYHGDRRVVATCQKCGRKICQDCAKFTNEKVLCKPCWIQANRGTDSVLFSALCCLFGLLSLWASCLPFIFSPASLTLGIIAIRRREPAKTAYLIGMMAATTGFFAGILRIIMMPAFRN